MNNNTKKIVRDYIYFTETLDDVKSTSQAAEGQFRSAMSKHNEPALEALSPPKGTPPISKIEDEEHVKFEDKNFKKLFRKLVVKCHPDKLDDSYSETEGMFLKECYENLTKSNQTYDWGMLLRVSIDLKVDVPDLSDENLKNIIDNIESIKNNISKFEGSMAYKWYTLPDENEKKGYLENCAKIFMFSLSKR
jgi:hypothetical protein